MSTQKPVTDALTEPVRRAPWIISGVAAIVIAVSAVVAGPSIAAQLNPAPKPAIVLPADAPAPLSDAELAAMQATADAWQAQIVADAAAKAAADAAAAQAAADAAAAQASAAKQAVVSSAPPHCPSGMTATQGDANGNPEWCLPTSCFGASPGPECSTPVAAIKP